MLYILNLEYLPNTAACNRLTGYYRSMDQMEIEATVVFLNPNSNYDKLKENFNHIKVEYYWKRWLLYRGFFRKITLSLYINRFIKRLKPGDIVYTYNISKLTSLCQQVQGVRVYAERTEHPKASNGFPHPNLALSTEEYKSTVAKLDGLFVISEPLKEFYSELGISKSKIEIINMTVDPSRFMNIKKTNGGDRYIAYCGTASNNKDGVGELIKAFAIVAKQVPNVKLYIIGKTPSKEQKFDNLDLVKSLGIKDRVVFTGIVKSADIPQLLKNAEVLALDRPDNLQAKYGFPTKLGEYLLTENPVVITSVGDIPKFLKDGVSALIARPFDSEDFSSKLIWALNNREEAEIIGKNGKDIAVKSFNSFSETRKLVDFINLKNREEFSS